MKQNMPFGLIGRKLGHSISPQVHAQFGNPDYCCYELEPEQLDAFFAQPFLKGLNVTIPYKQTVIPYCAKLDQLAEAIGSVNTMIRQADGSWKGYNTDAYGLRYLMVCAGLSFAGQKVLVLGDGGVSKTIQAIARLDGAATLTVLDLEGEHTYDEIDQFLDSTLIVNATPVGMYPNNLKSLVDLRQFADCKGVVDVIYNPLRTALLLQAEELGIPCMGGLPMLIAQAKQAEELFFDITISTAKLVEIGAAAQAEMESIVLIGMPGSGKSTIGAALSALTGMPMVDLDACIVEAAGTDIPSIFAAQGEDGFRRLESEQVRVHGARHGQILMTGGGVITRTENYAPLRQNGRIYQIDRPIEQLARDGRPLSMGADLAAMAEKRMPLYRAWAACTIDNTSTPQVAAETIRRDFDAYLRNQWAESEPTGTA